MCFPGSWFWFAFRVVHSHHRFILFAPYAIQMDWPEHTWPASLPPRIGASFYLAAWGVGLDEAQRWSIYVGWLWACWQGRVKEVIEELRLWQGRIGEPPEGEELDAKDPRRLVAEALSYRRMKAQPEG